MEQQLNLFQPQIRETQRIRFASANVPSAYFLANHASIEIQVSMSRTFWPVRWKGIKGILRPANMRKVSNLTKWKKANPMTSVFFAGMKLQLSYKWHMHDHSYF
ncbi:hypothetical protein CCACVL1_05513 [Corchorus capsularis]|uniref:Uncharacterized protein n=1 Tax=Corchorus capsularis TaxID=210143 RepID=A0A1R3JK87_COCAP|nr:hypothetical protein CCACVL1_05513 [Corchorus capsularis]